MRYPPTAWRYKGVLFMWIFRLQYVMWLCDVIAYWWSVATHNYLRFKWIHSTTTTTTWKGPTYLIVETLLRSEISSSKVRHTREVAEHEASITKHKDHWIMIFCWIEAACPLKAARQRKPKKSKKSDIVAEDFFPPLSSANIDDGM